MTTDAPGLRARLAAIAAMAMCCGLVMAIALGLVAVSGAWMLAGIGVAAIAACLGVVGWVVSRARRSSEATTGTRTRTADPDSANRLGRP